MGVSEDWVPLECDHKNHGDDHSHENLQTLCEKCHAKKSAQEGHAAYWAAIRKSKKKYRREEKHPGFLSS